MNIKGGCLVVAFTESPSDQAALEFQREVFEESIRRETEGIIFDVSGVSLIDSFTSKSLIDICRVGLILGKKAVVIGLKPAVVASLVDLEIDLSGVLAAVNVEEAIALIHPPTADAEPLEAKDTPPDEDAELKEDYDEEDEVRETEEGLSE
jgi:rsbT antagonist protein RsbS